MVAVAETWLVLGGGSTIGRAFAQRAAAAGAAVLLAGRDAAELERSAADLRLRHGVPATSVLFDALDLDGHRGFARACATLAQGQLNLLLAFGAMPSQAACEADPAVARRMVETNLTGAASVLTALAPVLRGQGGGIVVALGSVAGERGRPRNHLYGATKAALGVFLQGYAARHARHGVRVLNVLAGPVDTALTWPLPKLPFTASPASFATTAWRLARHGAGQAHVPRIWAPVMALIRAVPDRVFNRLDL
jgi:NAD(P)-dependent dehydrogenase (short-subunit alcohol dehydrogenase family)